MNPWQKLVSMTNANDVVSELEKKYNNCYIKYTSPEGNDHVLLFKGFDGNRFKAIDANGMQLLLNYDSTHIIENLVLKPGLYQAGNFMAYGMYTGARQYRKSINRESFRFNDPFYDEKQSGFELQDIVYETLNQQYPKAIKTAMYMMLEEQDIRSYAINREFGLYRYNKNIYFLYHNSVIGIVCGNSIVIRNKHFNQEVMDSHRTIDYNEFEVIYG